MENRNGSRAPNIYLLSWAFITGRNIGRILCEPLGHMQINICEAKGNLMITRITLNMKKKIALIKHSELRKWLLGCFLLTTFTSTND